MKRQILFLSMLLFAVWSVFSQTPYDNFAPEQSIKSMIEMPEMQFKVVNSISTNEVHSMEFDKKTLSLYLLNDNDSILKIVVLNLNDKKFISIDPLAEKYYSISPYAYCLNNPVRYVDPYGLDVWEINNEGKIINRIEDKTQDAFYMVAQDADGNYQRTYTVDSEGNKNYNTINFEYGTVMAARTPTINVREKDGTINTRELTVFEMKGDDNATQLFEFMANPGVTTNVEWSHAKVGTEKSERNIIGTSNQRSSTSVGHYLRKTDYTLKEVNHNHPSGIGRPSEGDKKGAKSYHGRNKNTILNIYTRPGSYHRYNQSGLIIP